jgi:hypothetical protein
MEPLVLTDKSVTPDDNLVFSIIGENKIHWQKLMESVHRKYPDAQGQWNYYNDGKSWLFKMVRKKKTLFWIGVFKSTFQITFYFGDKAEPMIESSALPDTMKKEFTSSKRFGKIRAIPIRAAKAEDVENALQVIDIKAKL